MRISLSLHLYLSLSLCLSLALALSVSLCLSVEHRREQKRRERILFESSLEHLVREEGQELLRQVIPQRDVLILMGQSKGAEGKRKAT